MCAGTVLRKTKKPKVHFGGFKFRVSLTWRENGLDASSLDFGITEWYSRLLLVY
ncbi:hypothetical protein ANO14919_006390 [Xylariales sp. No.14919]|nr:hypothetical protein ANO14919_006390 [Xylariales sp. No.14919]